MFKEISHNIMRGSKSQYFSSQNYILLIMQRLDIEKYHVYFLNNKYDVSEPRRQTKYKNKHSLKSNIEYDELFFNFLNNIRYEGLDQFYNKHIERQIKLKFVNELQNIKISKSDEICNNIAYNDKIGLQELDALCVLFKINMIYIHDKVFLKLFHSDYVDINSENEYTKVYTVSKDKRIYQIKMEKVNDIIENGYEIVSVYKVIKAIGNYKVDELKEIANRLSIIVPEKQKKNEIYQSIKDYLMDVMI